MLEARGWFKRNWDFFFGESLLYESNLYRKVVEGNETENL